MVLVLVRRPKPLYASTASQLGLHKTRGIPNLLDFVLPRTAPQVACPSCATSDERGVPLKMCMADRTVPDYFHRTLPSFCKRRLLAETHLTRTVSVLRPRTIYACHAQGLRPACLCAGVPRLAAAHAAHPALARCGLSGVEGLQLPLRSAGRTCLPPQ